MLCYENEFLQCIQYNTSFARLVTLQTDAAGLYIKEDCTKSITLFIPMTN